MRRGVAPRFNPVRNEINYVPPTVVAAIDLFSAA
jgi:hypothetical protein